jgi:hypothetical protein
MGLEVLQKSFALSTFAEIACLDKQSQRCGPMLVRNIEQRDVIEYRPKRQYLIH